MKNSPPNRATVLILLLLVTFGVVAATSLGISMVITRNSSTKVSAKENDYWHKQITNTTRGDFVEFQDGQIWLIWMNVDHRRIAYKTGPDATLNERFLRSPLRPIKRIVKREPITQEYYYLARLFVDQLSGAAVTNK